MSLRRVGAIAGWEVRGTLQSKQFIAFTLLMPLIMLGSVFLSIVFAAPELRGALAGLSPEELRPQLEAALGGDLEGVVSAVLAAIFSFIFLLVVLFSGTFVLQNIVREKQSRAVERLLAAVTPRELITGKILAFGALGLLQAAVWVAVGAAALLLVGPYVGVPSWPLLGLLLAYAPWEKLAVFLLYFALGYLFIASFSAGMGATLTDVFSGQQFQSLIVMIPALLPLMFVNVLLNDPESALFRVLSYVPPAIPGAMMLRMSLAAVSPWEVVASLAVLAASTLLMIRLAGKIFEVGILMYGKAASLKEIWRWARQKP